MTDVSGLIVVVDEERWDAYGNPMSDRDNKLMSYLRLAGGVSDTVEPGTYIFNAKPVNGEIIITLLPSK